MALRPSDILKKSESESVNRATGYLENLLDLHIGSTTFPHGHTTVGLNSIPGRPTVIVGDPFEQWIRALEVELCSRYLAVGWKSADFKLVLFTPDPAGLAGGGKREISINYRLEA